MDTTKLRVAAGAGAIFFGIAGVISLTVAGVIALATVIGVVWSSVTAAVVFIAAACICLYIFLEPEKATSEEVDEIEDATADALADLPFDTVKAIIQKRPLTSVGLALVAGYAASRDPESTARHAQRLILGLI